MLRTAHQPSFAQQRLWFVDRLNPGSPLYNVPVAVRLSGRLDTALLRRSLALIADRHEALRTVFEEQAGAPVQVVLADAEPEFTVLDVAGEAEARRRINVEAARPFDLASGPLLRVLLLRLNPTDHYLVLTLHHIVSDGWSLAVLLEELGDSYTALAAGHGPDLPELRMRYADFAAWQREEAAGPDGKEALNYWVDHLRGAPTLLSLPADRERPARQSFRGAVRSFTVPDELTAKLREVRLAPSGTLFMTLLAGYAALLSRYSGQDDVVIGTAVGGRPSADTERLIGFFVNTVPLRVPVAGDPSMRELVSRVRDIVLDGIDYSGTPFERIVETVAPQRDLRHAPIFQAQLNLQSTPPPRLRLPGITAAEPELVYTATSKVDLTVWFAERDGRLHADLEYSTDLFDADTIERMINHLLVFLTAAVTDPDLSIGDIPLLTDAEQRRALVDWNDTALPLPAADTVLDLIAAQVAARGGEVAVEDAAGTLTYAELDRRANRLAHRLRAAGVGLEVPVALCLERSAAMVVAVLAVWKAGGAYVPLDPVWPARRLSYMLADSGSRVVLVDTATGDRLAGLLAGLDLIDATGADLLTQPDTAPALGPGGRDRLAYLIYTSGSTGRPKGVAVPHLGVLNQIVAFDDLLPRSTAEVWAGVTTLSFDISVLELLLPLARGARLVVFGAAETADPPVLRARLIATGVTVLQATPSRWRLLLGAGGVPASVRIRLCGGEALDRELAETLAEGAALWNVYGPTETTIWASATRIRPGDPIELGPPIGNLRITVLDKGMRPVPVGVVGELHIGGLGVARGYHNRAELTARQFLPDPFGEPGSRLYATGDLARYRSNGRLEFLGRADHQVKLRGYRIELGEIEAALRGHAAVAEAVVVAWTKGADDTRLAAYVVPTEPRTLRELWESLRPHLADQLPDYMIPTTMVLLDALPMTPSGKADRGALPEPDWTSLLDVDRAEPATPVERLLAALWQELLSVPEVGRHDDFFGLGGHSMLAARLLARVRELFAIDVPVLTLFESRTVAEFADALERLETSPGHLSAVAIAEGH
jgi:amino acid adenylation domain-containing protein